MNTVSSRSLRGGLMSSLICTLLLSLTACGKPADAPAQPAAAPAAPATAEAPAQGQAAAAAPAPAADKKEAIDPLAHEGVPGLSDLFSKKKEGGGH